MKFYIQFAKIGNDEILKMQVLIQQRYSRSPGRVPGTCLSQSALQTSAGQPETKTRREREMRT